MSEPRDPYDASYPPSLWGGGATPATGATAGIPGTWTPPGSQAPSSVAALQAGTPNAVAANPATGWTAGQFVQTRTDGAAGRATWTGAGWVGGVAPSVLDSPGSFTIAAVEAWVDEHADLADEVLAAEEARGDAARTTLLAWLQGFISDRDDGHIPSEDA